MLGRSRNLSIDQVRRKKLEFFEISWRCRRIDDGIVHLSRESIMLPAVAAQPNGNEYGIHALYDAMVLAYGNNPSEKCLVEFLERDFHP